MRNLKRNEVDINNSMISIGLGLGRIKNPEERTNGKYIENLEKYETNCENNLMKLLSSINIDASVKTIPESLPYTHEITKTFKCFSYINDAFNIKQVYQDIVRELLNENVYKIRFYFYIDFETIKKMGCFGDVIYKFRYFKH